MRFNSIINLQLFAKKKDETDEPPANEPEGNEPPANDPKEGDDTPAWAKELLQAVRSLTPQEPAPGQAQKVPVPKVTPPLPEEEPEQPPQKSLASRLFARIW